MLDEPPHMSSIDKIRNSGRSSRTYSDQVRAQVNAIISVQYTNGLRMSIRADPDLEAWAVGETLGPPEVEELPRDSKRGRLHT